MRRFILPPGAIFAFLVLSLVATGIQAFVMNRIKANSVLVANAACTVERIDQDSSNGSPQLNVLCGRHKDWTNDAAFIVSYLQHPGTITCTLYENQSHAECALKKQKT